MNVTQLASARAKAWHQDGDALLTMEAAREWVGGLGLVLFAPRSQQLPAPAASFVEATLGASTENPTQGAIDKAKGILARLVAEGSALPLNLLGTSTDTPDFVVSAQVFSYLFTLRGDKAWKLPPSTSGAIKVSPLGLRVYETLTAKGAQTAIELAAELGREVTEAAIVRALVELWAQLRVIPSLQSGAESTLWELTTQRFTKSIKAGANAGQPSALSALISLYLAQSVAATEDEVETFLSPLTARSRVREVLHALTGARQLDTIVVEGKTLLHLPGTLPEAAAVEAVADGEVVEGEEAAIPAPKKIGTGRIKSFTSDKKDEMRGKPLKVAGAKPAYGDKKPAFGAKKAFGDKKAAFGAKPAFGAKKTFGAKKAAFGGGKPTPRFGPRLDGKTDPERRPFKKDAAKPTFTKPWEEDSKPKSAAAPASFAKFRKPDAEDRAPLGPREQAGLPEELRTPKKTSFDRAPAVGGFVKRSYTPKEGEKRPYAKKPYAPRGGEGGARSFAKPAFGPKPAFGAKKPFGAKPGGFGAKKPFGAGASEGGERPYPKNAYAPRVTEGGERPYAKKPYAPRTEGGFSKPKFGAKPGGFGAKKPYTPRAEGEGFAKRPYTPRIEGASTGFAKRPYTPRTTEGGERPYAKKPFTPRTEGGAGGFAKRPYVARSAEGGDRPFVKRPYTPRAEGEGGFKPRFGGASKPRSSRAKGDFTPEPASEAARVLPKKPYKPRAADAHERKFTKDPWVPTPGDTGEKKRAFKSSKPRYGGKSGGKFGGKPAGSFGKKPFAGKPKAGE